MDVGLVCDACSALTPIGVPQCTRCGAAVALDPRPRSPSTPAATKPATTLVGASNGIACNQCNTLVPANQKFCPNCGNKVSVPAEQFDIQTQVGPRPGGSSPSASPAAQATAKKSGRATMMFGGAHQSARAKLTLIRGDGEDGVSFTLAGDEHPTGRGDVPISFPEDPFLSPTHANFIYRNGKGAQVDLVVRDEQSLNGIYVRISGTHTIANGTTVLIGEQVLTIAAAPQPDDVPDNEGTYFSASMARPATIQISQHLRGGTSGWVYRMSSETTVLGREGNDINFPEDPFISGRHAELRSSGGVLSVTDLGSRNGTFVRVTGEHVLRHGDYVFLGQQLLRVEIV